MGYILDRYYHQSTCGANNVVNTTYIKHDEVNDDDDDKVNDDDSVRQPCT